MSKRKKQALNKPASSPKPKIRSEASLHLPAILFLVIFSTLIYANTLKNGFVYDDYIIVVNNTFIKDLNNLLDLFRPERYFASSGEVTYRPVVTFTYLLDYAIFGLKPWGFHLVNVLLHTVNGLLLYAFLSLLFGRCWLSLIFALIFVTHPVLTETVNAISYREDLLVFLFYMTALNLFLILKSSSSSRLSLIIYSFSCLSYLLALFSKEMAVTLPLIAFIYEWIYAEKRSLRPILSYYYLIGLISITLIYLTLRFTYFYNPVESGVLKWELTERLYTIPWLLLNYFKLTLFPASLSADHAFYPIDTLSSPMFLTSLVIIIVLLSILFKVLKKEKNISFGASFFILTLLPVSNIMPVSNPFAERYLYLPMTGIVIIVITLIKLIHRTVRVLNFQDLVFRNIYWLILLLAILFINSLAVVNRNNVWKDGRLLWTDTLKKSPESFRAHNELGLVYHRERLLEKAIDEYKKALKIYPDFLYSHINLGIAYLDKGQLDDALNHLKEAVRLNPYHQASQFALGLVYDKTGESAEAILHYTAVIRLNPYNSDAHNNLGLLYFQTGKVGDAIRHFETAIMINPLNIRPRNNLADLYLRIREYGKAIDVYRGILKIKPAEAWLHNKIGILYAKEGRFDEAAEEYRIALKLNSSDSKAYNNLTMLPYPEWAPLRRQ